MDGAYLTVITSMVVVNIFQSPNVDYCGQNVHNVKSGGVFHLIINSIIIVRIMA